MKRKTPHDSKDASSASTITDKPNIFEQMMTKAKKPKIDPALLPPGLQLLEHFITKEQHDALWEFLTKKLVWSNSLTGRRVKQFGFEYLYNKSHEAPIATDSIPAEFKFLVDLIVERKFHSRSGPPDQCIVNEYEPGQGIGEHIDDIEDFDETICALSLGSAYMMDFKHVNHPTTTVPLQLPKCSLLVLQGDARYLWTHGIAKRQTDVVGDQKVTRGKRISITFRWMKTKTSPSSYVDLLVRCIRRGLTIVENSLSSNGHLVYEPKQKLPKGKTWHVQFSFLHNCFDSRDLESKGMEIAKELQRKAAENKLGSNDDWYAVLSKVESHWNAGHEFLRLTLDLVKDFLPLTTSQVPFQSLLRVPSKLHHWQWTDENRFRMDLFMALNEAVAAATLPKATTDSWVDVQTERLPWIQVTSRADSEVIDAIMSDMKTYFQERLRVHRFTGLTIRSATLTQCTLRMLAQDSPLYYIRVVLEFRFLTSRQLLMPSAPSSIKTLYQLSDKGFNVVTGQIKIEHDKKLEPDLSNKEIVLRATLAGDAASKDDIRHNLSDEKGFKQMIDDDHLPDLSLERRTAVVANLDALIQTLMTEGYLEAFQVDEAQNGTVVAETDKSS